MRYSGRINKQNSEHSACSPVTPTGTINEGDYGKLDKKYSIKLLGLIYLMTGLAGLLWLGLTVPIFVIGALRGEVHYYGASPKDTAGWIVFSRMPAVVFFLTNLVMGIGLRMIRSFARILTINVACFAIFISLFYFFGCPDRSSANCVFIVAFLLYGLPLCYLNFPSIRKQFK